MHSVNRFLKINRVINPHAFWEIRFINTTKAMQKIFTYTLASLLTKVSVLCWYLSVLPLLFTGQSEDFCDPESLVSNLTPGSAGVREVWSVSLLSFRLWNFPITACMRFSCGRLRFNRDPCKSLWLILCDLDLQANHVITCAVPNAIINIPIARGAALKFFNLSLSFPVLVLALTPMQTNTSPPKTISGANPLESLEHLRARSECSSAKKQTMVDQWSNGWSVCYWNGRLWLDFRSGQTKLHKNCYVQLPCLTFSNIKGQFEASTGCGRQVNRWQLDSKTKKSLCCLLTKST